jgi:hypothetical protein
LALCNRYGHDARTSDDKVAGLETMPVSDQLGCQPSEGETRVAKGVCTPASCNHFPVTRGRHFVCPKIHQAPRIGRVRTEDHRPGTRQVGDQLGFTGTGYVKEAAIGQLDGRDHRADRIKDMRNLDILPRHTVNGVRHSKPELRLGNP